ncbi:MAG TPA: polysaccharide deacetylase family protein [Bacteroidales bacterium]|nr:polysaccharide deacetylase family protein [Bacteroidales bacterium]HSA43077.1 polysaccharide deacetylase family protein [Bacteroidales bacterium]
MYFITPPKIAMAMHSRKIWWRIPGEGRKLYLSFDDGPVPEVTLPLLDILRDQGVKATFFCVGENVFNHYPVYQQLIEEGHRCGNHTYNHLNGWKTPTETYLGNTERCSRLVPSGLFRPPHGRIRPPQTRALLRQFHIIQWSVLSGDFDPRNSPEKCLKNCLDHLKAGNIFVFHDSLKAASTMLEVVPEFIREARKAGFDFSLIPEMPGVDPKPVNRHAEAG